MAARRQLFQRPLFAYLTFSYFVRSIVLLAGFSTALQWWQYYALRGIHERDSDLQSDIGVPKSNPLFNLDRPHEPIVIERYITLQSILLNYA